MMLDVTFSSARRVGDMEPNARYEILLKTQESTMADDKENRGPRDRSRISLTEDYEVRYWTDKLGVSKDRLEEIVRRVGSTVAAVEEALRKQAPS